MSFTRILYEVERQEPLWLIRTLTCIYERDTLTPTVPGTSLSLDLERLAQFRMPYRYSGYYASLSGRAVGVDLYGDDQPDRVDDLYSAAFAWLRQ